MEYEVQSARITTTGKLPDRFLNCQSQTSKDLAKSFMGTVYSLVEINSPWFDTAQVGQLIINTFSQRYYHGSSTSDLDNLEESLKAVNENLAKITQDGQTSWVGKLNAVLAVVVEDSIHVAQTGHCEAYIFRDGKVNHLTYGLAQNPAEIHPLKTFSNITSGELKSHDKVLLANPDLFRNIDLETLKSIITVNSPNASILQIAKMLKKKKTKEINLVILDFLTKEEASRQPASTLPDVIQLDRPIESYWVYFEKIWLNFLKPFLNFLGSSLKKLFFICSQSGQRFAKILIKKIKQKKVSPVINEKDQFDREFLAENARDEGLLKDEEIKYSPELKVHYYEKKTTSEQKTSVIFSRIFNLVIEAYFKVLGLIKNKKKRPYLLIGSAIVVLLVLGLFINSRLHGNHKTMSLLDAQNILKEAEASQSAAKQAIAGNDQVVARTKFFECISAAQKINNMAVVKGDAQQALNDCQSNLDLLTSMTRYTKLSPVFLPIKELKTTFILGGQAIMINGSEVYTGNLAAGQLSKAATLPHNNGDFKFGVLNENSLYLYTTAKKVYEFDLNTGKLELANIDGDWEAADNGAFYNGNLYLLDSTDGQIYRHSLGQNGFAGGQTYINDASVDIKYSFSLAIDGTIYILRSSGDVNQLQKGKLQSFKLQGIPDSESQVKKLVKIYTDSDENSIFLLDSAGKRILEFDKDGHFTHQYGFPNDFNEISDFSVSSKAKKIWVTNGGGLYEVSM